MKIKLFIFSLSLVSSLSLNLNLSAKTTDKLMVDTRLKNIDDLPNDPGQMMTWTCRNQEDGILVEAKDDKIWPSIIKSENWNCQENLSDIPTGALKFTCEPSEDGIISILTVIWLTGKDKNKQMGQWIHEFADEYDMICSLAKVELWGD
jgi:hypothetical protein